MLQKVEIAFANVLLEPSSLIYNERTAEQPNFISFNLDNFYIAERENHIVVPVACKGYGKVAEEMAARINTISNALEQAYKRQGKTPLSDNWLDNSAFPAWVITGDVYRDPEDQDNDTLFININSAEPMFFNRNQIAASKIDPSATVTAILNIGQKADKKDDQGVPTRPGGWNIKKHANKSGGEFVTATMTCYTSSKNNAEQRVYHNWGVKIIGDVAQAVIDSLTAGEPAFNPVEYPAGVYAKGKLGAWVAEKGNVYQINVSSKRNILMLRQREDSDGNAWGSQNNNHTETSVDMDDISASMALDISMFEEDEEVVEEKAVTPPPTRRRLDRE